MKQNRPPSLLNQLVTAVLVPMMLMPPGVVAQSLSTARVVEHEINRGSPQRSTVTNITFRFDTNVLLSASNLVVQNLTSNATINPTNFAVSDMPSNVVTWTFPLLSGGTLPGGNYLASLISRSTSSFAGPIIDGDGNGIPGDPYSFAFFSRFGDSDGDRDVDFFDNYGLQATYGKTRLQIGFDPTYDINADGIVDNADLFAFDPHYFTILRPQPGIFLSLINDNGFSSWDNVTSDPGVVGSALRTNAASRLETSLRTVTDSRPADFVDVSSELNGVGGFSWSSNRLAELFGGRLTNASYALDSRIVEADNSVSSSKRLTFTLDLEPCALDLPGWQVTVSPSANPTLVQNPTLGSVSQSDCTLVLREGDSFLVAVRGRFTNSPPANPTGPILMRFRYEFIPDSLPPSTMRDAFEASLVDSANALLTHRIAEDRDSYFNLTDGLTPLVATGVTLSGQSSTATSQLATVSVDISHLFAGNVLNPIFRLVNNDLDRHTTVIISKFELVMSDSPAVITPLPPITDAPTDPLAVRTWTDRDGKLSLAKIRVIERAIQGADFSTTSGNPSSTAPSGMSLSVLSPLDGATVAPGSLLLSGLAGSPPQPNGIKALWVNGVPVEELDAAGGFFSRVAVLPGNNVYQVVATDYQDVSLTNRIQVYGDASPDATFEALGDVSGSAASEFGRTSLDQEANLLHVEVAIRNSGQYTLHTPLLIGLANLTEPTARVLNPDGLTGAGVAFFDLTSFVPSGRLEPGQVSGSRPITFRNPRRVEFGFQLIALSQLNRAPQITSVPPTETMPDKPYVYQVTASDPDGHTLQYSLEGNPVGMSIQATTGLITWTPTSAQLGNYALRVVAADPFGARADQRFSLSVAVQPDSRPPVFVTDPVVGAHAGVPYLYAARAKDPDQDPITYSLVDGPAGVTINSLSGLVEWRPTQSKMGFQRVSIQADDGRGENAIQSYLVRVTGDPTNHPPFITSSPSTEIPGGALYQYQVTAIDGDKDPLTYRLTQAPSNMVISPVGLLSWTNDHTLRTRALSFDSSDFVEIADDPALRNTNFTIEGWFSFSSNNASRVLAQIPAGTNTNDSFQLWVESGNLRGVVGSSTSNNPVLSLSLQPTNGTWYHLAYSFDSLTRTQSLFVNGILRTNSRATNVTMAFDGQPLLLGCERRNFTNRLNFFHGRMDEVRLWSRARTASEIQSTTNVAFCTDSLPANLVGNWSFEETQGVIAYDESTNHLNGTLGGTVGGSAAPYHTLISRQFDACPTLVQVVVEDGRGGTDSQSFTINTVLATDLEVASVDTSGFVYDGQTLIAQGLISATITNGGEGIVHAPFEALFFEDLDRNGVFDAASDGLLSRVTVVSDVPAKGSIVTAASVNAVMQFSGSPVSVWVDSSSVIPESDENNNYGKSSFSCLAAPVIGQFDPVIKWHKESYSVLPLSTRVETAPLVIDLNRDGKPEIVYITYRTVNDALNFSSENALRVVDGATGAEVWNVTTAGLIPRAYAGLAAGDINGDGYPDIVGLHNATDGIVAFDHAGNLLWTNSTSKLLGLRSSANRSYPSIVNLDGVGLPEVLLAMTAFRADGSVFWDRSSRSENPIGENGAFGGISIAIDLDRDGLKEVIAGKMVYNYDGSPRWPGVSGSTTDGFNAVGNFDADPEPEIVLVSGGIVTLLDIDGAQKWTFSLLGGGGLGGPPTIADFNGDGWSDIGVAGSSRYNAINGTNGSLIWTNGITDGSARTGSTVYDFEGDGKAEVVYQDEDFLHIFRGADGVELYRLPMGSGTAYEMPVVADVDGDGKAEIVVGANVIVSGGAYGLYVIEDRNDTWVATRPMWNQHTYHISNINDDGTIPTNEPPSWLTHNTFRRNLRTDGGGELAAPDLIPSFVRAGATGNVTTVAVRIGNAGSLHVQPGVSIAFYDGDPRLAHTLLATNRTLTRLDQGAFEDVFINLTNTTATDLWVVADDNGAGVGAVRECNEDNNFYHPNYNLSPINNIPVFTSTPNTNAHESVQYTYDVDATDADPGSTLVYSLRLAPPGMTIDGNAGIISWLPGDHDSGFFPVWVQVTDNLGSRAVQRYSLRVGNLQNLAPQFVSTPVTTASADAEYAYAARAADPEAQAITYDLVIAPDGMIIDPQSGQVYWDPLVEDVGEHDVIIRATDTDRGVALQSYRIVVGPHNHPPAIVSSPTGSALFGLLYQYQVVAQDVDGDSLAYSLDAAPPGMTISAGLGLLTWTAFAAQAGDHFIRVKVSDGRGGAGIQDFTLRARAAGPNTPPTITSMPRTRIRPGTLWRYIPQVTDPDGDILATTLPQHPSGMILTNSSWLQWIPDVSQVGSHDVTVAVTDGRSPAVSQSFVVEVSATDTNGAPTITSTPALVARAQFEYSYQAVGTDPDNDSILWALETAPEGMSVHPVTGAIRWSPEDRDVGDHPVVLYAVDPQGASAVQSFTVHVNPYNQGPRIVSVPPLFTTTNILYTYAVRVEDPENDPLTFTLTNAPTGMTMDARTGLIQWIPTASQLGSNFVGFTVVDPSGAGMAQWWRMRVLPVVNHAPAITSTPSIAAVVGLPYEYAVVATDPDGDALTLQLTQPPAGMTFTPGADGHSWLIAWTPSAGQVGVANVSLTVRDPSGAQSAQSFGIGVNPQNSAPTIVSTPITQGVATGLYRYDVRATDVDANPLTYALVSAPAGMTVDNSGRIRWTVPAAANGSMHVDLRVSDPFGLSANQSYDITIGPDFQPPSLNFVILPGASVPTNTVLTPILDASDNLGVAALELFQNGVPVPLTGNRATVVARTVGTINFEARVRDLAGNQTITNRSVFVFNPRDKNPPELAIAAPLHDVTITCPTNVIGTVTDANLQSWTLRYRPMEGGSPVVLATGTTPVVNGVLGKFDPTLLPNDSYVLELTADDGVSVSSIETTVHVSGELKLGNFRLSFTDLSIPVSGIPITVTRTYDTLHANQDGEMGYGWRFEISGANLRASVPLASPDEADLRHFPPFRDGTKVYVTLPGGKREGFTFKPTLNKITQLLFVGINERDWQYDAKFEADQGVTSKLAVEGLTTVIRDLDTGEYWSTSGNRAGFNPRDPDLRILYTLSTSDGLVYNIDGYHNKLTVVGDPNDNTISFTPNGVISSTGLGVALERDSKGRITAVTDPMGALIRYNYDAVGNLVSVTDRMTNTTQFVYRSDRAHYLDRIIGPTGVVTGQYQYDATGRLVELLDVVGDPARLIYSLEDSSQQVVDRTGVTNSYFYDSKGNVVKTRDPVGVETLFIYNADNLVAQSINALFETNLFSYDNSGNTISHVTPSGRVWRTIYKAINVENRLQRARGHRTKQCLERSVDPLGTVTMADYDSRGNRTGITLPSNGRVDFNYGSAGNITNFSLPDFSRFSLARDGYGRLKSYIDQNELEVALQTDAKGDLMSESFALAGVTNQQTFEYTHDSSLSRVANPNGASGSASYDANGRPLMTEDGEGRIQRISYNDEDRSFHFTDSDNSTMVVQGNSAGFVSSVSNSSGFWISRKADDRGLPSTLQMSTGRRIGFGYDILGRPTNVTEHGTENLEHMYDRDGQVTQVRANGMVARKNYYDHAGQLIAEENSKGNVWSWQRDQSGNVTNSVWPSGRQERLEYDPAGRLVVAQNAAGGLLSRSYGVSGHLERVTDQLGQTVELDHDQIGRVTNVVLPSGLKWGQSIDVLGRFSRRDAPWGMIERIDYDLLKRPARSVTGDGHTNDFRWDYAGRLTSLLVNQVVEQIREYDASNRLIVSSNAQERVVYSYYEDSRLRREDSNLGYWKEYEYDAQGRITALTTAFGRTTWRYGDHHLSEDIEDSDLGVANAQFDLEGNLLQLRGFDGVTNLYGFNRDNSLESYARGFDPTSKVSIEYDQGGNPSSIREASATTVYSYDLANRLINERVTGTASADNSFEYNSDWGLVRIGNGQIIRDNFGRVSRDSEGRAYLYDSMGRVVSRSSDGLTELFQYDSYGRLSRVERSGASLTRIDLCYGVDGLLQKVIKDGSERVFLWNTQSELPRLLEERSGSGGLITRYVHCPGVTGLFSPYTGARELHLLGLGHLVRETDSVGATVAEGRFSAYGESLGEMGETESRLLFERELFLRELGLYYLRSRWYDPSIAQFLTPDIIPPNEDFPQTWNPYGYAAGNPIRYSDPFGTWTMADVGTALAIAGVLANLTLGLFPDTVQLIAGALGFKGIQPIIIGASMSGGMAMKNYSLGLSLESLAHTEGHHSFSLNLKLGVSTRRESKLKPKLEFATIFGPLSPWKEPSGVRFSLKIQGRWVTRLILEIQAGADGSNFGKGAKWIGTTTKSEAGIEFDVGRIDTTGEGGLGFSSKGALKKVKVTGASQPDWDFFNFLGRSAGIAWRSGPYIRENDGITTGTAALSLSASITLAYMFDLSPIRYFWE